MSNFTTSHLLTVLLSPPSASSRFPNLSPLPDPPEPELELIIANCRLRLADDDIIDEDGASVNEVDNGSSGIVEAVESWNLNFYLNVVINDTKISDEHRLQIIRKRVIE